MKREVRPDNLAVMLQRKRGIQKVLADELGISTAAVTGGGKYVFPTARTGRCISDMAINTAMREMGLSKETITGHGFRAMARTLLDEVLHYRIDYIEHQLAHAVKDPLGRAYNRTTHLKDRVTMMQTWADYLDSLKMA